MSNYTVVKDWVTAAGFRAVIIMNSLGYHCGYVGVPKTHPLYGKDYSDSCEALTFPAEENIGKRGPVAVLFSDGSAKPDVVFDVRGSLTYADGHPQYPVPATDIWWFGYDCGHYNDAPSDQHLAQQRLRYPDMPFMWTADGVFRDVEYNIAECESLAEQLISRVNFLAGPSLPLLGYTP